MADVQVFNGAQLLVQLESAPGSGTFEHDCLINTSRGIKFNADVVTTAVPDCDDLDAPAWNQTEKSALGCSIDGAGKTHLASVATWDAYFRSKDTRRVRVKINKVGGVTWEGAFHCTAFEVTGSNLKEKVESTVALVADGEVTLAAN
jgi:hypothetical protein